MLNIHYTNNTKTALKEEAFFETIRLSLKKHGITDNVDVELQIVGQVVSRKLNKRYRTKDYATDVLSFPIWPNLSTIKEKQGQSQPVLLGSIVICLPVALRDAKRDDKEPINHLQFLIDHSVQHLLGVHHEGDE